MSDFIYYNLIYNSIEHSAMWIINRFKKRKQNFTLSYLLYILFYETCSTNGGQISRFLLKTVLCSLSKTLYVKFTTTAW